MIQPEERAQKETFSIHAATAPGIAAVKHNWAPFLLMQGLAATLVFTYYRSTGLREATESLQHLKETGGVRFDLVSGSISGGLLPSIARAVTGKVKAFDRTFWLDTLFNAFVYAIVAIQVDFFYRYQGIWFGTDIHVLTLVKKTVVDMGLFSPFLCIPTAVILFEWRKAGFSLKALLSEMRAQFYLTKVVPTLIPCWAFWIPMLFCVYAMPPNLQLPLSQVGEASWCLLFVFIATA